MTNMQVMCTVLLDTKGSEIQTGLLKDEKPITITTDYDCVGEETMIALSYKKLAEHVDPESMHGIEVTMHAS
ncbi:hypothetical protein R1flu_025627 [Riccia fluitans]|uniref:Uncharacterized protein n=1 Tax=Riccia fluitans TaxID=41844 RepID=A0ABD1XYA1_9MARC